MFGKLDRTHHEAFHQRDHSMASVCRALSQVHDVCRAQASQALANGTPLTSLIEEDQTIDFHVRHIAGELLEDDIGRGPRSWNDTMRLYTMLASEDQIIYESLAFQPDQPPEVRETLHDGTYGIYGILLETSLDFLSRYHGKQDYNQLTGTINEQTTLALLNRSQLSSRAAHLSDAEDDYKHGIDILYYRKNPSSMTVTPIQVKSSRLIDTERYASDIVVIDASMFASRTDRFHAARLILDELNGTISDENTQLLDTYMAKLFNVINTHKERQLYLGHLGIKSGRA